MKNSKKEIYAAHDIQFENGKILAPVFGWIAPLLVNGNAKLGAGVLRGGKGGIRSCSVIMPFCTIIRDCLILPAVLSVSERGKRSFCGPFCAM